MRLRLIRLVHAGAVAALSFGCATVDNSPALVDRAVAAMGGAEALRSIKTLEATGTSKHWEPDQSHAAGGEFRLAGDSSFTLKRDFAAEATRIDWQRKLVYPGAREYRFTEILAKDSGYVAGVDSTARVKQSVESNPPAHSMSRFRVAAMTRELERSSPLLLLQMQSDRAHVSAAPDMRIGEQRFDAVNYTAGNRKFVVLFDPATGLPARIRTFDYDSIQGDSTFDLALSDWRDAGGAKIAHRHVYQLNGGTVVDTRLDSVRINPSVAQAEFEIPAEFRAASASPTVTIPYQWVLRRQFIGVFLDTDHLMFDPNASQGLRLQDVGPGLALVQGGTHNSLIVEMSDHLIVFDAPINDAYSQWVLKQLATKYPGKPVRTLVLTHHHQDHTSGARAYVAQGATLVVGAGNGVYFRRMLLADHAQSPYLPKGVTAEPRIVEVPDRMLLTDARRNVHIHRIENPHSEGAVIGYVEDAKLGFVTDLWSPGQPLGARLTPGQSALVTAVRKAGIAPERFAGGHGSVASYGALTSLESK